LVTHGLQYHAVLSISTIVRVLEVLTAVDPFDEHDQSNDFALELHLRCVVSALRIIHSQGTIACARHLTFDLIERIYVSLAKWGEYHCHQAWQPQRLKSRHFVENYNNEFLTVYAKDLVAAVSCDRDLTVHAVTHIAAGIPLYDMVCPGLSR